MAQRNWIYPSGLGRQHQLGLYHADESGNLVVHLNNQVLVVDFKVLDDKAYTFFIDEELCQVKVIKDAEGQFSYEFTINYEADTPQNRLRKDRLTDDRESYWKALGLAILVLAFFFILAYFLDFLNDEEVLDTGRNFLETSTHLYLF